MARDLEVDAREMFKAYTMAARAAAKESEATSENTTVTRENTKVTEENTLAKTKNAKAVENKTKKTKEEKVSMKDVLTAIKEQNASFDKQAKYYEKRLKVLEEGNVKLKEEVKLSKEKTKQVTADYKAQTKELEKLKQTKKDAYEVLSEDKFEGISLSEYFDQKGFTVNLDALKRTINEFSSQELVTLRNNSVQVFTLIGDNVQKVELDFKALGKEIDYTENLLEKASGYQSGHFFDTEDEQKEFIDLQKEILEAKNSLEKYKESFESMQKTGQYTNQDMDETIKSIVNKTGELTELNGNLAITMDKLDNMPRSLNDIKKELEELGLKWSDFGKAESTTIDKLGREVKVYKDNYGNILKTIKEIKKVETEGGKTSKKVSYGMQLSKNYKELYESVDKTLKKVNDLDRGINRMRDTADTRKAKELKIEIDGVAQSLENLQYQITVAEKLGHNKRIATLTKEYVKQKDTLGTLVEKYKDVTAEIRNQGGWMLNLKDSFIKAFRSFTTYMTVTNAFYQTAAAIRSMINEVKELDKELTEFKKVSDLTGESLDNYVKKAGELGTTVAKTTTEMINAATQFRKSGFSDKDALELGRIASMYTNIADEEISAADAADMIVAQMKAFKIEAKDAIHIVDAINEVSNNFAVSSADIANNLGKASAVMANAGNSMEQYIGLMTAGTEVTRNAAKTANGLKTLTLRLQGMNDEGEKDLEVVSQMQELYTKLGTSVYKADGELKNTYELLEELANIYPTLTNAQKAYVTETIAGKNQSQIAAAILTNWETAMKATTTAMNSNGSAAKENAKVLDSIEGHLQKLRAEWQKLATSLVESGLLKTVTDLLTTLLKLANTGVGIFTIKVGLVSTALSVLVLSFKAAKKEILKFAAAQIISNDLLDAERDKALEAAMATMSLGDAFKTLATKGLSGLKTFITSVPGKITIIITVIYGLYKLIKWMAGAAQRAYDDITEELKNAKDELEQVNNKLDETKKRIEEIQNKGTITLVEQNELDKLKSENKLLTAQSQLLQDVYDKKLQAQQEAADLLAKQNLGKYSRTGTGTVIAPEITAPGKANPTIQMGGFRGADGKSGGSVVFDSVDAELKNIQKLRASINATGTTETNLQEYKKDLDNAVKSLEKYQGKLEESMQIEGLSAEAFKKYYDEWMKIEKVLEPEKWARLKISTILAEDTESVKAFNASLEKLNVEGQLNEETVKELLEEYPELNAIFAQEGLGINDLINNYENLQETIIKNVETLEDLENQFGKLQDAYTAITGAVDEYNNNGKLSIDTMKTLMENGYWQYLDWTGNSLKANTKLIKQQGEALKAQMIDMLQTSYAADVLALSQGDLEKMTAGAKAAVSSETPQIKNLGDYSKASAGNLFTLSKAAATLGITTGDLKLESYNNQLKKLNTYYNNVAKGITKLGFSISSSTGSASKGTAKWEKELESLNNQYKNNEITIEVYIDKLEKLAKKYKKNKTAVKELTQAIRDAKLEKLEDDYKRGLIGVEEYIEGLEELQEVYEEGTKEWNKFADSIKKGLEDLLKDRQNEFKTAQEAAVDMLDDELDTLDKLKDETEKYYDELIAAKEKANDETEKELELARLQEALENARNNKNKRVFVQGMGWQWVADEQAISEAEKALSDFQREQEVSGLESEKEAAIQAIEDQINSLQSYRDEWKNITDEYEQEQNRLILDEKLGAYEEADILNQRIDVLEDFKNRYLAILRDVNTLGNVTADDISLGRTDLETVPGYASGGVVDYTGYAKVHGSASRPEIMLNNAQAASLYSMLKQPQIINRQVLGSSTTQVYNFDNLVLPNVSNARQFINELKTITNITKNQ